MVRNEASMVQNEASMLRNEASMVQNEASMVRNEASMLQNEAAIVLTSFHAEPRRRGEQLFSAPPRLRVNRSPTAS
jgi:DNA-binding XRE family transcriptional regulator